MSEDLYASLGVPPTADAAAIKKAHRKRAKETYPERDGGDRDAFDKAQRAWLVLSDPTKRQRYDETGDADSAADPEAAEMAEAMNAVTQHFSALIGGGADPRTTDIVLEIKRGLKAGKAQIAEAARKAKLDVQRLEEFRKRLKRKAEGEDRLALLIDGQLRGIRSTLAQVARADRIHDKALALVEEYGYEVDKAPQPPSYEGFASILLGDAIKRQGPNFWNT